MNDPNNIQDINKIKNAFKEVDLLAEWIESTINCEEISNQMEPMKNEIKELNNKKK